jgi:GT2 family glycosyltransferase
MTTLQETVSARTGEKPLSDLTSLQGWRIAPRKPVGLEDCCLIIATYQRPNETRELIASMAEMPNVPAEVLIVDGSPGDETEFALLELSRLVGMPFELMYMRSPKGLTRQRNVGVDISTKRFLFFLDDDAMPLEGYFSELHRVLANDVEESIGAAGACILNEIAKPIPRRWRIRRAIRLIPRTPPLVYNDAGTSAPGGLMEPFHGTHDVDIFAGGACAIRRKVFESMRFSEFFCGYSWGEDLEMSLRIRRKWRVVCCGDARVVHYGVQCRGGRPDAFTKGRMEVRNRYFIWRRHSRSATLLNRVRFRLDLLFLFLMDLLWFVAHPRNCQHLSHACGLAVGAVNCAISPPKWEEPAPVRQYQLGATEGPDRVIQCHRQTA